MLFIQLKNGKWKIRREKDAVRLALKMTYDVTCQWTLRCACLLCIRRLMHFTTNHMFSSAVFRIQTIHCQYLVQTFKWKIFSIYLNTWIITFYFRYNFSSSSFSNHIQVLIYISNHNIFWRFYIIFVHWAETAECLMWNNLLIIRIGWLAIGHVTHLASDLTYSQSNAESLQGNASP